MKGLHTMKKQTFKLACAGLILSGITIANPLGAVFATDEAITGPAPIADPLPAEKTWVGEGSDGNFSTAANWSDNIAPKNGDTLILSPLPSASLPELGRTLQLTATNDIENLSINGIKFICEESYPEDRSGITLVSGIDKSITLTGDVTSNRKCQGAALNGYYKLGGNISVKDVDLGASASSNHQIALGGQTLTIESSIGQANVYSKLIGSGTVNYRSSGRIFSESPYVGTTNINISENMANAMQQVQAEYLLAFGNSSINIEAGKIHFALDGEYKKNGGVDGRTLSNKISIKNTVSDFYSLSFGCTDASLCSDKHTLKVPNITLLSDVGMASKSTIIDLAGITSNDHCIDYDSSTSSVADKAKYFINGPEDCPVEDTGSDDDEQVPGVPNTSGFSLGSPIAILSVGAIISLVTFFLLRGKNSANQSK